MQRAKCVCFESVASVWSYTILHYLYETVNIIAETRQCGHTGLELGRVSVDDQTSAESINQSSDLSHHRAYLKMSALVPVCSKRTAGSTACWKCHRRETEKNCVVLEGSINCK